MTNPTKREQKAEKLKEEQERKKGEFGKKLWVIFNEHNREPIAAFFVEQNATWCSNNLINQQVWTYTEVMTLDEFNTIVKDPPTLYD